MCYIPALPRQAKYLPALRKWFHSAWATGPGCLDWQQLQRGFRGRAVLSCCSLWTIPPCAKSSRRPDVLWLPPPKLEGNMLYLNSSHLLSIPTHCLRFFFGKCITFIVSWLPNSMSVARSSWRALI